MFLLLCCGFALPHNSAIGSLNAAIHDNTNFTKLIGMAHQTLQNFTAGSSYPQIWIRDSNTFLEIAMEVVPHDQVLSAIMMFLERQQPDGDIVDGVWVTDDHVFKNTVETDQETSFVQALRGYVRVSGDVNVINTVVKGSVDGLSLTVRERIERAFGYLWAHRYNETLGLLYGATTIDWGDVQPEDNPGIVWNNLTHAAVDIYDNAMMCLALNYYAELLRLSGDESAAANWTSAYQGWAARTRTHLWDVENRQFRSHLYGDRGSPFPASYDEEVYFHGGTAVAALAGLLNKEEILDAYNRMKANVAKAGGKVTIGLTVYPPYPDGYFANPCCSVAYSYQNGGDWDWFGGRMVQALIQFGYVDEAIEALQPMVDRVVGQGDFNEWYDANNKPQGSWDFHGSAGVLGKAIRMLGV